MKIHPLQMCVCFFFILILIFNFQFSIIDSIEQSRLFETDLPNFRTSSQVFKVTSGGVITLPCEAANLSKYTYHAFN